MAKSTAPKRASIILGRKYHLFISTAVSRSQQVKDAGQINSLQSPSSARQEVAFMKSDFIAESDER